MEILLNIINWLTFWAIIILILLILLSLKYKFVRTKKLLIILVIGLIPYIWLNDIKPNWKNTILGEIEKARYCEVNADCVRFSDNNAAFYCDNPYINKKEVEKINQKIRTYESLTLLNPLQCDMIVDTSVKCENKICRPAGFVEMRFGLPPN